ncbi:MAG: 2,3,4,5-tetrahydropyridine-2,6-dicarboxylate N-succinyltransferase [Ignavibacteriae bacterium]|nr:MAG: 2,3,4,5-tetrahydropyridine-2,6-dicarboxylate N-succinyltransferase [Ignavibacteriota bacterium]
MILKERIELFYPQDIGKIDRHEAVQTFNEFKFFLNNGEIRAASPSPKGKNPTGWTVNDWVKKGILLGFRLGELIDVSPDEHFRFFDISTFPLKKLTLQNRVRLVPGGSAIRDGSYVAPGVVILPPSYINVGAYVDGDTAIDSQCVIGCCAQIGRRVRMNAGVHIGGTMESPVDLPVIIEDDVFIGGQSVISDGAIVKQKAVIAAGVILTGSTTVYDIVNEKAYRRSNKTPLIIPEHAVVVPGSRAVDTPYAKKNHLALSTALIIKYRDPKSDAAAVLEESLR